MECSLPLHVFSKTNSACFYDYIDKKLGCLRHCRHPVNPLLSEHRLREWQTVPSCVKYFPPLQSHPLPFPHLWQPPPAAALAVVIERTKLESWWAIRTSLFRYLKFPWYSTSSLWSLWMNCPSFLNQNPPGESLSWRWCFLLSCELVYRP